VNNRAYYFTSRDFATRHTDVLRIAIEEINTIEQWISKNKPAAALELSNVLGLDKSITELFLNRVATGPHPSPATSWPSSSRLPTPSLTSS